ncbi:MAG: dihydroorotate dehydrogenase electron transfer subunit [Nitrospinota bacterium]|nr:dihydroorotate dehydrogenase electron transfer subunit [Nitrospinota bacterium]MDP7370257.1 dihydroorotate dehydrogenase electron transfer subunit [Nitrospinota bacterium]
MREIVRVIRNLAESPWTNTLFFDREIACEPGQFMMVWLPRLGEKPFTLSYPNGITVKRAGRFTEALTSLGPGDTLGLRGPLGRGYPLLERPALVGGGVGIAELRLLALRSDSPTFILGGRTAEEILYFDEFQSLGPVKVATEDGSLGEKGLVTDLLPVDAGSYAVCGPERMMVACRSILPDDRTHYAIERYMKCAVGLCGQCTCSGQRVCVDGPIFPGKMLESMPDFGHRRRSKSGRWEKI